MNCINRHTVFGSLLKAWNSTGNPAYAKYFSDTMEGQYATQSALKT